RSGIQFLDRQFEPAAGRLPAVGQMRAANDPRYWRQSQPLIDRPATRQRDRLRYKVDERGIDSLRSAVLVDDRGRRNTPSLKRLYGQHEVHVRVTGRFVRAERPVGRQDAGELRNEVR